MIIWKHAYIAASQQNRCAEEGDTYYCYFTVAVVLSLLLSTLVKFPGIISIANSNWPADLKYTGCNIEEIKLDIYDIDIICIFEIHGLAQYNIIFPGMIRIQDMQIPFKRSLLLSHRFSDTYFIRLRQFSFFNF